MGKSRINNLTTKKWFEPKSKWNTDIPGQKRVSTPAPKGFHKKSEVIDLDALVAQLDPNAPLRKAQRPCVPGQKAIWKVRAIKSPIGEELRGYRVQVAMPNMDGHKPFSTEPAPSWRAPWLLFEFGDFDVTADMDPKLELIWKFLDKHGFARKDIEDVENYKERKEVELDMSTAYVTLMHKGGTE